MTAKRPVGRPALFDAEAVRKTVHLPAKVIKAATKAGDGSLSRGIASAFTKEAQRGRQHRLVEVTDLAEIEAIKLGLSDTSDIMTKEQALLFPIGGEINGRWYAEADSIRKWRRAKE